MRQFATRLAAIAAAWMTIAVAGHAGTFAQAPQKPAATPARPAVASVTSPEARAAFFTRILSPQPDPATALPAAADAYRRGLTFATQGAWSEAQQAFRDAEKKDGKQPEHIFATAFANLKLHKASEAQKRYQDFYKKDPSNTRALVGLIASAEETQYYRDAVTLWQRYLAMPLPKAEAAEARAMTQGARELFAARYEIEENPAGGATNIATPQEELALGLEYAKSLSSSGVPLVSDPEILRYVEQLCQNLVDHAKQFPTNYQLFVLDTAQVNATTTPGFIFVYRGILDASDSEAALAGVLAHEIGHSVAHHIGKSATKSVQDQKQIADLKKSNSKMSQFLAKMLESGNAVSDRSFSRENEAQADRLAVHIAFDSGYDPTAIADLFQKFEQMSPTSRSGWDQMMRSHPPSIDRINTVKEYAALLPDRSTQKNTAAFSRMKKRLAALPPPPDATGMLKASTPTSSAKRADVGAMRTSAFSLNPLPFSGEVPEGWTGTKISANFFVFRGPAGTGANEAGLHFEVMAKASYPGKTMQDVLAMEQAAVLKLAGGVVIGGDVGRTNDGRPMLVLQTNYACTTTARVDTVCQRLTGLVEFPDYFVLVKYVAPKAAWDNFSYAYEIAGNSLTYGLNRTAPVPQPAPTQPAPSKPAAPSTPPAMSPRGNLTFATDAPAYGGEMPQGWVMRKSGEGVFVIEGNKGTEPYEMSIRVAFYNKATNPIDAAAEAIRGALKDLPGAQVQQTTDRQTQAGRPARVLVATYTGKISTGAAAPFKQMVALVEYANHLVIVGYVGPASLFDKYLEVYQLVGTTLAERRSPAEPVLK